MIIRSFKACEHSISLVFIICRVLLHHDRHCVLHHDRHCVLHHDPHCALQHDGEKFYFTTVAETIPVVSNAIAPKAKTVATRFRFTFSAKAREAQGTEKNNWKE